MADNSSFNKGKKLEKDFSEFMKSELGYDKVKTRKFLMSSVNARGSEVDIVGIETDDRGDLLSKFALLSWIAAVPLFIAAFLLDDLYYAIFGGLCLCLSIAWLLAGRSYFDEYTWVECKAWNKNIPIKEVRDCYARFNEYNSSKDKNHSCHKMIFVAEMGFVQNAELYAKQNNIVLYIRDGSSFKKLEYWD